ncbi:MAG: OadG family protein [Clostridia bacterium]|nr:OadG family protein [Clostridia bacterium]
MLTNLLTNATLPEGYQEVSIGTVSLYALIGYLIVFAGIAFLIFIVWLVGKFMTKPQPAVKNVKIDEKVSLDTSEQDAGLDDEVDEETAAVIMAALMAYYETNYPKCEFTVKRIKRVRRNDYA